MHNLSVYKEGVVFGDGGSATALIPKHTHHS